MIDPTAVVRDIFSVGEGTKIGAFSIVGYHASLGQNVEVGSRVIINGSTPLGENGSEVLVEDSVLLGDGCVIVGPARIGTRAIVKPGAVITGFVPPFAIIEGNPAQVVGYANEAPLDAPFIIPPSEPGESISVAGCDVWRLPRVTDVRGNLTSAEIGRLLPFEPKRFFLVYDVPNEKIRGTHAHHELHELLICACGSVTVTLDNGVESAQVLLDDPSVMIHLKPKTWTTQYNYSHDAVLIVLCSHVYEADDYIREYGKFLEFRDA
jgi:UDP-2-acetamido-3-amino-2,3-dideoxy-glucuronate N-acetyltransferase